MRVFVPPCTDASTLPYIQESDVLVSCRLRFWYQHSSCTTFSLIFTVFLLLPHRARQMYFIESLYLPRHPATRAVLTQNKDKAMYCSAVYVKLFCACLEVTQEIVGTATLILKLRSRWWCGQVYALAALSPGQWHLAFFY
jgi:hypothetical protein